MKLIGMQFVWLLLYWYYLNQIGTIQKGKGRRIVTLSLSFVGLVVAVALYSVSGAASWDGNREVDVIWNLENPWMSATSGKVSLLIGWAVITLIFLLYDVFFDEEDVRKQWWRALLPGVMLCVAVFCPTKLLTIVNGSLLYVMFLLMAGKRDCLNLCAMRYGSTEKEIGHAGGNKRKQIATINSSVIGWGNAVLLLALLCLMASHKLFLEQILVFAVVELTIRAYQKSYEVQTVTFQQEILGQQYEEIKSIYLDMRGWRHDYHNHIQVMKAQLKLNEYEEMEAYLNNLEQDLSEVDSYVKSGNLMTDAILNSKVSLARQKGIDVNCKAVLPENLPIEDVDLCVILGNLLDNAIEAFEDLEVEKRFLRIYLSLNKSQLYMSIQNSAKDDLDFDSAHYITHKRGNHGLGMKRVAAMVEKYDGYLNLANEPGIFAAEVTMPMEDDANFLMK